MLHTHHLRQFGLLIFAIVVGLGVSYVSAWTEPLAGTPPTNCPTNPLDPDYNHPGCRPPINTSTESQVKEGNLGLGNNFTVNQKAIVDEQLGLGPIFAGEDGFSELDADAALDIDGLLRVRGPSVCAQNPDAAGCPKEGRVLVARETGASGSGVSDGSVEWATAGLTGIRSGSGIVFCSNSDASPCSTTSPYYLAPPNNQLTSIGTIALDYSQVQKRVADVCGNSYSAMHTITADSDDTVDPTKGVLCRDFITSVTPGVGLAGTTTGGVANLSVNLGAGLKNDSGKIALDVDPTGNGGVEIASNRIRLRTSGCSSGQTLSYDGTNWTCGTMPTPPSPNALPGESVMYLRGRSDAYGAPPSCPSGGSWSAVASPNPPGLTYTSDEHVGYTNTTRFNRSRVCFNTVQSCQVVQLKSTTAAGLASCSTLAGSWSTVTGTSCSSGAVTSCAEEYASGGVQINFVRTCYKCN